ncbi:hypothetical protein E0Z10_g1215 [Xylaria hypoxylon]|uniref:FAD-binding domain-containing protein n=1 Tax=Xylaria hypoxylon TaxID=37992 RepID=A0A4Z0ZD95_9PEZI|nr:hypothetical protein E0Z10_g1215 [Xylaria hypoxylon]
MMNAHEGQGHFLSGKKIVVSGAGISGLAFAIALRKLWPPSIEPPVVVIYDRDAKESSIGREGYSLSLNGIDRDSGLYALKQLGLLDEIIDLAVFSVEDQGETGHFTMWTHEFRPMISVRPKAIADLPTAGMRIARKDLRRVLVEAASASTEIHWGTTCTSVQQLEDGRLRLRLVNEELAETDEECDILVAADGASSKIRACLRPDDNLEFAGSVQMAGSARFEAAIPSPLDINWGGVLTGTGAACFFSRVDQHTLVWALSILELEPRSKYDNHDPQQVQELLRQVRELGKDIAEPFKAILDATDPSTTLVINAKDKQPFPHDMKTGPVLFIGDANHAVSPFAGNGANLALKDGWDLAEQLCQSSNLSQAVKAYDKRSVPRAVATLKSSRWRIKVGHATGMGYWMYRIFFAVAGTFISLLGR